MALVPRNPVVDHHSPNYEMAIYDVFVFHFCRNSMVIDITKHGFTVSPETNYWNGFAPGSPAWKDAARFIDNASSDRNGILRSWVHYCSFGFFSRKSDTWLLKILPALMCFLWFECVGAWAHPLDHTSCHISIPSSSIQFMIPYDLWSISPWLHGDVGDTMWKWKQLPLLHDVFGIPRYFPSSPCGWHLKTWWMAAERSPQLCPAISSQIVRTTSDPFAGNFRNFP